MRHYYLTKHGRLSRRDNTLLFEISGADETKELKEDHVHNLEDIDDELNQAVSLIDSLGDDELGKYILEDESENASPVNIREKRSIPIADVDAIWAFKELDLNSRVLSFLSQHKKPIHFFNYYGFYSGSFYPREYLQAGFVLTRQFKHYNSRPKRLKIAKEFIAAGMHNIIRNLRYYANRGVELLSETEFVQAEILRLDDVKTIETLMGCEGRARAAYYKAFEKIIKRDVEFKK